MKKISVLLLVITAFNFSVQSQGYKIKFNIKNLNDSVVYLARYYGDNKYIKDTVVVDGKEKFTIEGDEELECGIYMIVREKRNAYFEFLVSNQNFTVISDTTDFIGKTEFKNSPDNQKLYDYFRFTDRKGKLFQDSTNTCWGKPSETWHPGCTWTSEGSCPHYMPDYCIGNRTWYIWLFLVLHQS